MKADCEAIVKRLETCPPTEWAAIYVNERIRFHRAHCMGYLFSTIHDADFFSNVLRCLAGAIWEPKGEYEDNFRKFIKHHRSKYE